MTTKQYRTAMGKTVDMGALMLQNEGVRAVGNMAVNAKGDKLNSNNQIIDRKAQQVNRQAKKQAASAGIPTSTSNLSSRQPQQKETPMDSVVDPTDTFADLADENEPIEQPSNAPLPQGGLAAAIAKAKTVQQTKITPPSRQPKTGVRKI